MKGKIIKIVIIVLVIALMLYPICEDVVVNTFIKKIKYEDIALKLESQRNYDWSMIYVAPSSEKGLGSKKTEVKEMVESYKNTYFSTNLEVFYLDYDKLDDSAKKEIFGSSNEKTAYMFLVSGEILTTLYGEKSTNDLSYYVSTYSGNGMNPNFVAYKVAEDASEFKSLIKRKKDVTMAVFGHNNNVASNNYQVMYNQVAIETGVDIYYFNTNSYDADEYEKIKKMGLTIPASCSPTNAEVDFQDGFDIPLTLFIKNNKVFDCISSYATKSEIVAKLKSVGMLETEEE